MSAGGYVRRGFCPQGVLFRGLCPQGVLSAGGYVLDSIYSGPLDFDVFEFYSILDFNSKGSYQIASIFDM